MIGVFGSDFEVWSSVLNGACTQDCIRADAGARLDEFSGFLLIPSFNMGSKLAGNMISHAEDNGKPLMLLDVLDKDFGPLLDGYNLQYVEAPGVYDFHMDSKSVLRIPFPGYFLAEEDIRTLHAIDRKLLTISLPNQVVLTSLYPSAILLSLKPVACVAWLKSLLIECGLDISVPGIAVVERALDEDAMAIKPYLQSLVLDLLIAHFNSKNEIPVSRALEASEAAKVEELMIAERVGTKFVLLELAITHLIEQADASVTPTLHALIESAKGG